jgi:hypothetical protein
VYTGSNTSLVITLSGTAASVGRVYGSATLVVDGTALTLTGAPPDATSLLAADVVNGGAIGVSGATDLVFGDLRLGETTGTPSGGTLTISAAVTLSGAIREVGAGNGTVNVSPTATVTTSTAVSVQAALHNAGMIAVNAGQLSGSGSLTQTGGLTTVAAGAVLDKNVALQGGTLRGSGTVGSIQNTAGTVEPGSSPGTFTVTGSYTQGPGGTLQAEITDASTYDRLSVNGAATLGGTLAIVNDGAFTPALTNTFGLVTTASRTGQFAALTGDTVGTRRYRASYTAGGMGLCVSDASRTACGPPDTKKPQTTITAGPGASTRSTTATFRFKSSESGSTFKCKLDKGAWKTCTSAKTYRNLRKGAHTFQVRARDKAGNVDATPAKRTWRIT